MASESNMDHTPPPPPLEPIYDLPPESFWVSTADEQDWFDRYAVMQRKTSLKLGGGGGFNNNHKKSSFIPHHRSDAKNKKLSSLLGLAKGRKSFGPDRNLPAPEKKPLFRSRSEPGGGNNKPQTVQVSDPGSPRVSCTGRIGVRARSRSRSRSRSADCKKNGFSKLFGSLFGSGAGRNHKGEEMTAVIIDK